MPTILRGSDNFDTGTDFYADSDALTLFNASGSAPVYACRAWVSFNGTNGTINASGNVSSVTDNGTGNFTANFTTAMPDANYAVGYAGFESGSTGARLFRADASKTASSLQCLIRTTGSSTLRNCDEFTFSIFR